MQPPATPSLFSGSIEPIAFDHAAECDVGARSERLLPAEHHGHSQLPRLLCLAQLLPPPGLCADPGMQPAIVEPTSPFEAGLASRGAANQFRQDFEGQGPLLSRAAATSEAIDNVSLLSVSKFQVHEVSCPNTCEPSHVCVTGQATDPLRITLVLDELVPEACPNSVVAAAQGSGEAGKAMYEQGAAHLVEPGSPVGNPSDVPMPLNSRPMNLIEQAQDCSTSKFINLVSINAGRKLSDSVSFTAWLEICKHRQVSFEIAFITEVDGLQRQEVEHDIEGWTLLRSWPGPGSWALAFAISNRSYEFVVWRGFRGRAAGIHYLCGEVSLFIVGVHGGHHRAFTDSMDDVFAVCASRPPKSELILLGDWNADMIPQLPNDPWASNTARIDKDAVERATVLGLFDALRCELIYPSRCDGIGISCYSHLLAGVWHSRLPPTTESENTQLPSWLDYLACSHPQLVNYDVNWCIALSDHAALFVRTNHVRRPKVRQVYKWRPISDQAVACVLKFAAQGISCDKAALFSFILSLQHATHDETSKRERRAKRMPSQVRWMLAEAEKCGSLDHRRRMRRAAWQLLKKHVEQLRTEAKIDAVKKGHAIQKQAKLKKIDGVTVNGKSCFGARDWLPRVAENFSARWRGRQQAQEAYGDFKSRFADTECEITHDDLSAAFLASKRDCKISYDGTCMRAWWEFFQVSPSSLLEYMRKLLCDPRAFEGYQVRGRPFAKSSSITPVDDIRLILPMSPILSLVDILLSSQIRKHAMASVSVPRSCYIGGSAGTQVCDIVAGISLTLERGKDRRDAGASAQADIMKYYDSISPLLVHAWMQRRGFPAWVRVSSVFYQLSTDVQIMYDGVSVSVGARTTGTMTGTRVAGAMGECIILDLMSTIPYMLGIEGFCYGSEALVLASWVDNIYTVASSSMQAIANLEIFERALESKWKLRFKPSSKLVTSCSGVSDLRGGHREGWTYVRTYPVLGCHVRCDGSHHDDLLLAERAAWTRFWLGPGKKVSRPIPAYLRAADAERCCLPAFTFRCSWWQYSDDLCARIRAMQKKMICVIKGWRKFSTESWEEYQKRRSRLAHGICCKHWWNKVVAARILSWYKHCRRAHVRSWATIILAESHELWLQNCRKKAHSKSIWSGSTKTRAGKGRPCTRFEAGVEEAREVVCTLTM